MPATFAPNAPKEGVHYRKRGIERNAEINPVAFVSRALGFDKKAAFAAAMFLQKMLLDCRFAHSFAAKKAVSLSLCHRFFPAFRLFLQIFTKRLEFRAKSIDIAT
jgi:hypothetical protein